MRGLIYYFCMTQETVRRLPFRCYTRKGSDLDQSQQTNKQRNLGRLLVSLLHQKRLGSGSEPTKEKIKLLK